MNSYVKEVLDKVSRKNPWEQEFIQSVTEVFDSISIVMERDPVYREFRILERLIEPERTLTFRVPWRDAGGQIQINTGYRVEFNSALGPYKGGLRFHASVTLSILKFLGFEQIFKNALTGLAMGGGKGGSDFSPRGRTDVEIENFCQSFMTELERHIGINTDVPAGDIGVGAREIGYLFGQYKRLRNAFEGVLTGKGPTWGGSLMRPEATGYGLVYFVEEMLKTKNEDLRGKSVAVSGFGNVAWGAVKKLNELGARVVTLSGPDGFIHDRDGVTGEKIDYMCRMRLSSRDRVQDYADKFDVPFYAGKRPWGVKVDVALPCAKENELDEKDAKALLDNGVACVAEGANLPTTLSAMELFRAHRILYAPGKASNAGGVACSGLEMAQNSMRTHWNEQEVDRKLHEIMRHIHSETRATAEEYDVPGNYVMGANILGFKRVAEAMIDQGNC